MSFAHFVSLVPVAVLKHSWHSVEGHYSYSLDGLDLEHYICFMVTGLWIMEKEFPNLGLVQDEMGIHIT